MANAALIAGSRATGATLIELRPVVIGVDTRRPGMADGVLIAGGGAAVTTLVELRLVLIGVDAWGRFLL